MEFFQDFKNNEKGLDIEAKKADIEKRRQDGIELMLKEKAVEINENNFDFKLFGIPEGFGLTNAQNYEDQNFYQSFYDGNKSDKELYLTIRPPKIIYAYKRNNLLSKEGRPGSFFGMSIELDEIYCTDFEKIERFFDQLFEKRIVEMLNLLKKTGNPNFPYIFNINSFRTQRVQREIVDEIKSILLKNFKNKNVFGNDLRKIDKNFEKNVGGVDKTKFFVLHREKKGAEDTKTVPSKFFDFDRNEINAKYDKELAELEEAGKKSE